jgi:opacity protein-like surface antigen
VTDSINVELEYRYTDYGSTTRTLLPGYSSVGMLVQPTANVLTFGAAWKF